MDDEISAFIANQANEAIKAGADPQKVSARLAQMVAHLRNNRDRHEQANDAIRQGVDPQAVASKLSKLSRHVEQTPDTQSATEQYDGTPAKAGIIQSALHGVAGGFSEKIGAGAEALRDAVTDKEVGSGDFSGTFGKAYEQNLGARKAALAEFEQVHPRVALASQLGGGVATAIASGGTGAPAEVANLGRLAKMGQAAKVGAGMGAVYGAGDAHGSVGDYANKAATGAAFGGVMGGATPLVGEALGGIANKLHLPQAASAVAGRVAQWLPDDSRAQRALQTVARSTGKKGAAATEVGRRMQMDEAAGYELPVDQLPPISPTRAPDPLASKKLTLGPRTPVAFEPGIEDMAIPARATTRPANLSQFQPPPMALDRAGPNVEGLAKSVVRSPGPGKSALVTALKDRQAQMRPAVTGALEAGSGRPTGAGLREMQQMIDHRSAQAKVLYGAAREATKGQPVTSATLDEILQTPAGKSAFAWAKMQKGNRNSPLARVSETIPAPEGIAPEDWANMLRLQGERGLPMPTGETKELPDPETLHYMKQALAKMARLGMNDGAQGTAATQAQGALQQWGAIRSELPAIWQKADDAFAEQSRLIDMLNQGRRITRTSANPATANPKRALGQSLGAAESRVANASAPEMKAFRSGAAHDVSTLWDRTPSSVQSPGRVFNRSPERARQVSQAFPSAQTHEQFQGVVKGWDDAQAMVQRILGGSDTAGNLAESASRDVSGPGAAGQLVRGNFGQALQTMFSGLNKESENASKRALDAEIAKILASPDVGALRGAKDIAALRQRIQRALLNAGGGVGAVAGDQARQNVMPR